MPLRHFGSTSEEEKTASADCSERRERLESAAARQQEKYFEFILNKNFVLNVVMLHVTLLVQRRPLYFASFNHNIQSF
jgi:hypothetical protein